MATITLPEVPKPPPPQVVRFDKDGKPTTDQVQFENKMKRFCDAVKAALEGL